MAPGAGEQAVTSVGAHQLVLEPFDLFDDRAGSGVASELGVHRLDRLPERLQVLGARRLERRCGPYGRGWRPSPPPGRVRRWSSRQRRSRLHRAGAGAGRRSARWPPRGEDDERPRPQVDVGHQVRALRVEAAVLDGGHLELEPVESRQTPAGADIEEEVAGAGRRVRSWSRPRRWTAACRSSGPGSHGEPPVREPCRRGGAAAPAGCRSPPGRKVQLLEHRVDEIAGEDTLLERVAVDEEGCAECGEAGCAEVVPGTGADDGQVCTPSSASPDRGRFVVDAVCSDATTSRSGADRPTAGTPRRRTRTPRLGRRDSGWSGRGPRRRLTAHALTSPDPAAGERREAGQDDRDEQHREVGHAVNIRRGAASGIRKRPQSSGPRRGLARVSTGVGPVTQVPGRRLASRPPLNQTNEELTMVRNEQADPGTRRRSVRRHS